MHSILVSPLEHVQAGGERRWRLGWSTSHPQCPPVQPPLKRALYWINVGLRVRVGRGNLNRGERGVSQLFQVKVEFGASVFVCDRLCLGLTLTSCKA